MLKSIRFYFKGISSSEEIDKKATEVFCMIYSLLGFIGLFVNNANNAPKGIFILMLTIILSFLLCFYLVRKNIFQVKNYWIPYVLAFLLMSINYFYDEGYRGTTLYFWLINILFISILQDKTKVFVFSIFCVFLTVIFLLEYLFPSWVYLHESRVSSMIYIYLSVLCCGIIISLIAGYIIKNHKSARKDAEQQKTQIEEQKEEILRLSVKEREVNNQKLNFFTRVSHEIRTPLTLVNSPIDDLISMESDIEKLKLLKTIQKSTNKINSLVDQVIDLENIAIDDLQLNTKEVNIIDFIQQIIDSQSDKIVRSNINLKFKKSHNEIIARIDTKKIERVILNLLSNSFKFTQENAKIEINVSTQDKNLYIGVKDYGTGISKKDLPKIFDPFFQSQGTNEGTGIGLAIVKQYIQLHNGEVNAVSEPGNGTLISIKLPVLSKIYDIDKSTTKQDLNNSTTIEAFEYKEINITNNQKQTLLVIDDNLDILDYLKIALTSEYKIVTASDGSEGLNEAITQQPDLIISDIMMPEIDGLELCKKIKTSQITSHIPVILVTAKATDEQVVDGYNSGADAYVTKPFKLQVLKSQIQNLIQQRQELRKKFSNNNNIKDSTKFAPTCTDDIFIKRVISIINDNMSDPEFSTQQLVNKMKVSRSLLHLKIKKLLDINTSEVINTLRLQKSLELIKNSTESISEIAYKVGFKDPAYYSKLFKKKYGRSPNAYRL